MVWSAAQPAFALPSIAPHAEEARQLPSGHAILAPGLPGRFHLKILRAVQLSAALAPLSLSIACTDPFLPAAAGGAGGAGGGDAGGAGGVVSCSPGQTESCYEGPPSTEGVGTCKPGTRVCNADGNGWGACQGGSLPAETDDCATAEDENCNGASNDGCTCEPMSVGECYSGPAGTAGVGLCVNGTQTCKPDATWGVCVDETVPAVEDCSNATDEDCDGSSCGEVVWATLVSVGVSTGAVHGFAVDEQGNTYVVGEFSDTIQAGADVLVAAGDIDGFLLKIDTQGHTVWGRRFGSAGEEAAEAVAVHPGGGVVVTGGFSDTLTIGGTTLDAGTNAGTFIVRVDAAGDYVWSARDDAGYGVGGTGSKVAVAATGEIYVGGIVASPAPGTAGRVQQWSASGQKGWGVTMGGTTYEYVTGIAVDSSGSVVAVGIVYEGAMLDGEELEHGGVGPDIVVFKVDGAGSVSWSRTFGGDEGDAPHDVALSSVGEVFVGGRLGGDVSFNGTFHQNQGGDDAFLVKLTSGGGWDWLRTFGSDGNQAVDGMALGIGGPLVVGVFQNDIDLGGGVFSQGGSFVGEFENDSTHAWSRGYQGARIAAVAPMADGTLTVGGTFLNGSVQLGSTVLDGNSGAAAQEMFVARIGR